MKTSLRPLSAIILTFSVVFTAGFFILLLPRLQTFGKNLAQLDAATAAATTVRSPAVKPGLNASTLADQATKVDQLLPDKNELYDLSIQIEALGKQAKVNLTSVSLIPTSVAGSATTSSTQAQAANTALTPPAGAVALNVLLTAAGTYAQVQSFTEGLTALGRYVEISNLILTKGTTDSNVSIQITATAYYLNTPDTSSNK